MKYAFLFLFAMNALFAAGDPLPSWNDGKAKQAILYFVHASNKFLPPENRIATFDQDGTLWVEHPLYAQASFALDRLKAMGKELPENKPIDKLTEHDWEEIIATTHAGMSTEEFQAIVREWLVKARHPRFKQPYTSLVYQPMIEVLTLLRENGFKTYICTGGGQEFVRVFSQAVYGISPEQVVGSSCATRYEYRDGKPILFRLPKLFFDNNNAGKAIGINLFIGKQPAVSFGNSDGDKEMLEWTKTLKMLVHHDDPVREYAYGPDTHVGTFSQALMDDAKSRGWIVISMKNDWKQIFSFEQPTE